MKEYDPVKITLGGLNQAAEIVDTALESRVERTKPVLQEIFKRQVIYRLFGLRYGNS